MTSTEHYLRPDDDPLLDIALTFHRHQVEFIVVGSYCLLLQGHSIDVQNR